MYRNEVFFEDDAQNVHTQDLSVPLKIVSCGHYKLKTVPIADTHAPTGRYDYQLLYIASGKGYFYFNGVKTVVEKGHMVLYRPGESQIYDYYGVDKTEVFWIHFTGSEVDKYLTQYQIPKNEHVFFAGASMDYPWIFKQIILEMQRKRVNYKDLIGSLFKHILIMINRYIIEGNEIESQMINEIEKSVHYFNNNFSSQISVEDYAKKNHMSVNWFIHCFKAVMKITPMQYILSLRISNAKSYLESTEKTVAEISSVVGYNNSLYFSRIFKKNTGMSPSEYRKANRTISE